MERIREEEKEKIKYILANYDENDPVYIEARQRVEYEVECLRREQEESFRQRVEIAKNILDKMDLDTKKAIKNGIIYCKKSVGEDWLEKFEEEYEHLLGSAMAVAYEEKYGLV